MTAIDQRDTVRNPLDPDVSRSTKATTVLLLGAVAALTGALIGGVIPGTVALLLARATRNDLLAAGGYLDGARHLRLGVRLAWVGILLALAAVVVATIIGLLHVASSGGGQRFAPGTD